MAAVADLDDHVLRLTGGGSGTPETKYWHKHDRVAGAAATVAISGKRMSLWRHDGYPGAGVAPGAVRIPTRATAGALGQTNPGGGRQKWLIGGGGHLMINGGVELYDRLLDISGFDATTTSAQTVGGTMTRYATNATCVGNQIWIEIYTVIGTTGTTITASYTNQAGTAGQVTSATAVGATSHREVSLILPLQLASGDTGVQAVASVTVLATTGTAGDFGVTVARPLGMLGGQATSGTHGNGVVDFVSMGGPRDTLTDACIATNYIGGATIPRHFGWLHFYEA